MRIALDAMGSDNYPTPDVSGALLAAKEYGDTIVFVGDKVVIEAEIRKHDTSGLKFEVVHAEDFVTMHDKPSIVTKSKPHSSMHIGMNLVKSGDADALVTAGNTGAALAIATLSTLHRISGVKRPALSSIVRIGGKTLILLDIGANSDCKPDWLAQFALMGNIYAQNALGLNRPRVGLLSNGEEEGKGNQLVRDSGELIAAMDLNFVGNIEPKDMLKGDADVIISDGFVGNIAIKSLEALGDTLFGLIREELTQDIISKIGAALVRPALRKVYKQVDPFEIGGAPLLGVNGVVIIGHGRSNATAIKNAIRQARQAVAGHIIETIREGLGQSFSQDGTE